MFPPFASNAKGGNIKAIVFNLQSKILNNF